MSDGHKIQEFARGFVVVDKVESAMLWLSSQCLFSISQTGTPANNNSCEIDQWLAKEKAKEC